MIVVHDVDKCLLCNFYKSVADFRNPVYQVADIPYDDNEWVWDDEDYEYEEGWEFTDESVGGMLIEELLDQSTLDYIAKVKARKK